MRNYILILIGLITFLVRISLKKSITIRTWTFLSSESGINATLTAAYRQSRPDYREEWYTYGEWTSDLMLEREVDMLLQRQHLLNLIGMQVITFSGIHGGSIFCNWCNKLNS